MAEKAEAPLDDLMMAMDVVDTLRHDQSLVMKELGAEDRDARMIERLREVYAAQGIDVPDHILEAGVEGLKEDRFVYSPPSSGTSRLLALAYVSRMKWAKWLGALLLVLVLAGAGWQFLVVAPRERAAEALQLELSQQLPARLATLSKRISGLTDNPDTLAEASRLMENGLTAAQDGKAEAARKAAADLDSLVADLAAVFEVRIVSRPKTPTGVTRIPDVNRQTKNYYLVVEAIDPDGNALKRSIVSEEDGKIHEVNIWAQRVSKAVFDRIRRDKQADGIVQETLIGNKERGQRTISWISGVQQGAITEW